MTIEIVSKSDVGRVVIYQPRGLGPEMQEIGRISSLSLRDDMVFVRYGSDFNAKGTLLADLSWYTPVLRRGEEVMGDGPGYDFQQSARRADEARRHKRQLVRRKRLEDMISEVGFGEYDPNPTAVDDMITRKLAEAYELLCLVTRLPPCPPYPSLRANEES